jgi:tellurite resistance protein
MFLNLLNQEEKNNFIELVYKVANCDGNYTEDEEELLISYKSELGIVEIPDTKTIEKLISYFAEETEQIQKIVWFELYGMIMSDNVMSEEETRIIELVRSKFTISEDIISNIRDAAATLQKAYDNVYHCLF